jgi:TolB-like protein/Tfp pilus assembly protein PilF
LAVLPFVNMSADSANEYFSDGITDEILNALTHVDSLRVAARTSSFSYKGKTRDVRTVGKELGVQMVLEGSVRRSGNNVRIAAQLINAADGYQIWSHTYDRELHQMFAVQDEIARAIADALQMQLSADARALLARPATTSSEAFDLYLRGKNLISFVSKDRNDKAVEYLQRAVEIDPKFAEAHAALAVAYIRMGEFAPGVGVLPKAKAEALRALELDSTLVDTRLALSDVLEVYDRDWAAAENEIKRALHFDDGSAAAHFSYASFLLDSRRFKEAEAERRRAWEIRRMETPDTTLPSFRLEQLNSWAGFYLYIGDYQKATDYARAVLELDPADVSAHWVRAMVYHDGGYYREAIAELERIQRESANPQPYLTHLARAYASAGRRADALAILDTLQTRARTRYIPKDQIALIYYALGDTTQALDWLERAVDEYHWWMPNTNGHVLWRGLWANPRFQALMRKLGAPPPN